MPAITGRPGLTPAGAATTWTAGQAAAFAERCVRSHTVRVKVDVYRWDAEAGGLRIAADIPVTDARLMLDASQDYRRSLSVVVPGQEWVPATHTDPLTPFGQWLVPYVAVDLGDGSWSNWLKLGEFAIQTSVVERPSGIHTVEAADWSAMVDAVQIEGNRGWRNRTPAVVIGELVDEALPKVYRAHVAQAAKANPLDSFAAKPGQGRWQVIQGLADRRALEVLFNANGDLVIRREITDEDTETGSFPAEDGGPDIGTKTSPTAVLADGEGGSLIALTATVTREGGINRVVVRRTGTVTRQKKGKKKGNEAVDVVVVRTATRTDGPTKWGDVYGRVNLVEESNAGRITDAVRDAAQRRADALLRRRGGVIRYLDLDALPMWWLEPDDVVRLQWGGRTEHHYVQAVTFDLTGGAPMRVRTRQLAVEGLEVSA
jgi:hypothetical protein